MEPGCCHPGRGEAALSKTSSAVSDIVFAHDANEFTSYSIEDDGVLDVTSARNTPDLLYSKNLDELKQQPDIKSVLAGKDGPTCSRF